MADYQKLYYTMFHALDQAVHILIEAQQECEELFLSSSEPELTILPFPTSHSQEGEPT